jgi:hypothetical protein
LAVCYQSHLKVIRVSGCGRPARSDAGLVHGHRALTSMLFMVLWDCGSSFTGDEVPFAHHARFDLAFNLALRVEAAREGQCHFHRLRYLIDPGHLAGRFVVID